MNNVKELMKKNKLKKMSKKDKKMILTQELTVLRNERLLTITVEEIAELINVVSNNMISKKDYIHTLEEIVDLSICIDTIKLAYKVSDNDLAKVKKSKIKSKTKRVFNSICDLSKASQNLCKAIRYNETSKLVSSINLMAKSLEELKDLYKIKDKDFYNVESLKLQRTIERINSGTIR